LIGNDLSTGTTTREFSKSLCHLFAGATRDIPSMPSRTRYTTPPTTICDLIDAAFTIGATPCHNCLLEAIPLGESGNFYPKKEHTSLRKRYVKVNDVQEYTITAA